MKAMLSLVLAVALTATVALGGPQKKEEPTVDGDPAAWEDNQVDVVLVSVEDKFTPDQLDALLKKYNMTVVYDYQNFNMYAFQLEKALSKADMDAFLAKLEREDGILMAEADSKAYLMDEKGPGGAIGGFGTANSVTE